MPSNILVPPTLNKNNRTFSGKQLRQRIDRSVYRLVDDLPYESKQIIQFKRFANEIYPLVKFGIILNLPGYLLSLKHCCCVNNHSNLCSYSILFQLLQYIFSGDVTKFQIENQQIW